jgi:hypothetical protein
MLSSTKTHHLYLLPLFLLLAMATAHAQSVTDGATPLGLSPGMPAGSYALSDFDAVNLYNGNLGFRLPLLSVAGRGSTEVGGGQGSNSGGTHDVLSQCQLVDLRRIQTQLQCGPAQDASRWQ